MADPKASKIKPADETDLFIREVDEDLREEHLTKLWKAYGNYIIGGAVALVLGVAGYQAWHNYDLSRRAAWGERFGVALEMAQQTDKTDAARQAFAALAADTDGGYKLMIRFQDAALLERIGDRKGAAAAYFAIADDGGAPQIYRDLATVLGAYKAIDDAPAEALAKRVEPLTADANPWRHSARELAALLARKGGDGAKAKSLLTALVGDLGAPQGIRNRAQTLLGGWGG